MQLWEEAPKTEICGIQIYSFGLYCAIGAVAATAAILLLCRAAKMRKGTGTLLSCMSIIFGLVGGRLVYCLLHNPGGDAIPLYAWFRISTGGYSLFGVILGTFAAALLCAALTGENRGALLDITACAIPLFVAAERFGERIFEGFDISRQLENHSVLKDSFLAVKDTYYEDVSFLAVHLLSAICAILLFLALVFLLTRPCRRNGDIWIAFMLLCGAGGVLMESLRYDFHLEISFVYLQQIMAALMLVWGTVLSIRRRGSGQKGLMIAAVISLLIAVGVSGWVEYALDRTAVSHALLYLIMSVALAVPVTLGIIMLRKAGKEPKPVES